MPRPAVSIQSVASKHNTSFEPTEQIDLDKAFAELMHKVKNLESKIASLELENVDLSEQNTNFSTKLLALPEENKCTQSTTNNKFIEVSNRTQHCETELHKTATQYRTLNTQSANTSFADVVSNTPQKARRTAQP